MREIWKNINENYQISNFGRVKSLDHYDSMNRFKKGKLLKELDNGNGYKMVHIYPLGKISIHRLVAKYFIGKSSKEINHINGEKSDNRLENLEYSSRSENELHKNRIIYFDRNCILDNETGIFYSSVNEIYECFNHLTNWSKRHWRDVISGKYPNNFINKRFIRV